MANPRRSSGLHFQNLAADQAPLPPQAAPPSRLSALLVFLKRPHAFPFLLSVFILLTWVSLRFQRPHTPYSGNPSPFDHSSSSSSSSSRMQSQTRGSTDAEANLVRFSSLEFPVKFLRDKRGWLLNPVTAALDAGISGGAKSCASVHVGEIHPGGVRGNHRHHTCNETFILWGAMTKFRLERADFGEERYAEATIGTDEVAIAASPSGRAHALVNTDPSIVLIPTPNLCYGIAAGGICKSWLIFFHQVQADGSFIAFPAFCALKAWLLGCKCLYLTANSNSQEPQVTSRKIKEVEINGQFRSFQVTSF